MTDFAGMRAHMVDGQILPNRVTDPRLIEALSTLPREDFVPTASRAIAYVDDDLEIARGRYIMEPRVLARMIQEAGVTDQDVALDIGCGFGYSTALLARMAGTAVGVESDPEMAARASELLTDLEIDNALIFEGPLAEGYPSQAPYDVILISGAVPEVPANILDQLADGGRLIAVVSRSGSIGDATLVRKSSGLVSRRVLFDAAVPPLPGFEREPAFSF